MLLSCNVQNPTLLQGPEDPANTTLLQGPEGPANTTLLQCPEYRQTSGNSLLLYFLAMYVLTAAHVCFHNNH